MVLRNALAAIELFDGNVASAEGWEELLPPEIERQRAQGKEVAFRGDAAFAKPEVYEALEDQGTRYAVRLPANDNLERNITELLKRPAGRPSYRPLVRYKSFLYQAASWKRERSVVAKLEFHFAELFPRVGFIVTNLTRNRSVARFYNKRGTAERWTRSGKRHFRVLGRPHEAEVAGCGAAGSAEDSNRAQLLSLQTAWRCWQCDSGFKMEILS